MYTYIYLQFYFPSSYPPSSTTQPIRALPRQPSFYVCIQHVTHTHTKRLNYYTYTHRVQLTPHKCT
uniref:Uncharacterized protein n=1 Tax=Anguilla anguilla TaxID=7936 RepID=A0A0E9UHX7_ANGAN